MNMFWLYIYEFCLWKYKYAFDCIWTCMSTNVSFWVLSFYVLFVCCFHYLIIYEYVLIVYVWILFVKIWLCFWFYLNLYVYAYECIILSVVFVCIVCVLFSLFMNTWIYFLLYLYIKCVLFSLFANISICFDCICMNIVCENMNMLLIVSKLVCLWMYHFDCCLCMYCLWVVFIIC